MAIQQTFFNAGSGLSGYQAAVVGDGVSNTVSIDFYDQIAADKTIKNKTPTGIFVANAAGTAPSSWSLSGTVVTFVWTTALAANALVDLGVFLTFNP